MTAFKYQREIDLAVDNAHSRVIRLVGEGKRVLELGCATGYMSRVLVERYGCVVTGVERDAGAAEAARKLCRRVVVGDLETLDYVGEFGQERFDVVTCADVLEHLREPARVLAAVRGLLAPEGYVVASIPNVAHASVIADLLEGRFTYRPLGLLDDTHLRFFTRHSVYACFEEAGLVIDHLERLHLEPEATEFHTDLGRLPPAVASALRAGEESVTYQFVVRAVPGGAAGGAAAVRTRLAGGDAGNGLSVAPVFTAASGTPTGTEAGGAGAGGGAGESAGTLDAVLGRMRFLEEDRERARQEAEASRARAERLAETVATHEGHIRHLQGEVAQREEITARQQKVMTRREEELRALHRHVNEITSSRGYRLLERARRLRARVAPPGSVRERLLHRLSSPRG